MNKRKEKKEKLRTELKQKIRKKENRGRGVNYYEK